MSIPRNETTLHARWSHRENDLLFHHPAQKPDGHLLYGALCAKRCRPGYRDDEPRVVYDLSFVEELEARGYDITTLKFSVRYRSDAPPMQRRFRRRALVWFRYMGGAGEGVG